MSTQSLLPVNFKGKLAIVTGAWRREAELQNDQLMMKVAVEASDGTSIGRSPRVCQVNERVPNTMS